MMRPLDDRSTFADYGINLDGRRGEIDVKCPWCADDRKKKGLKTLSVNTDKGTWYCHHCSATGGLETGITEQGGPGEGFTDAERKAFTRPAPPPADPTDKGWERIMTWMAGRGIPENVVRRNRIVASHVWFSQLADDDHPTGREAPAIAFPFYRSGELINTKYRGPQQPDGSKTLRMEKNAERIFYGLDDCDGYDELFLVEGEMDKLAIEVAGFVNCLSVPDGAPPPGAKNYQSKLSFLDDPVAIRLLTRAKKVILATDDDPPGRELKKVLSERIGKHKCYDVDWQDGMKDANEVLMTMGASYLAAILEDARPLPVEGLVQVDDVWADVEALWEVGLHPGYDFGYAGLDPLFRPTPGSLVLVTGSPGAGKSTVLDNLAARWSDRHGHGFAICSPEQLPITRHIGGLVSIKTGLPFDKRHGMQISLEGLRRMKPWLSAHYSFVLPRRRTFEAIMETARVEVMRKGIKGLIIDPWNKIEILRPPGVSETDWIGIVLSAFQEYAIDADVCVFLVAHPTKLRRDDENGLYPVATPYDISGSANFYNMADWVISVWRDTTNPHGLTEIHVQKVRFREQGRIGTAWFRFDDRNGRLTHEDDPDMAAA